MSTAATAQSNIPVQTSYEEPALPLRSDTLLGVCEAIGQDLGFHPNWLRVPFAALILWNPPVIIGSYLALGCVVAATRFAFPDRRPQSVQAQLAAPAVVQAAEEEKELLAA
jgi:phage shock protein PspC (stress-responsive transcriptional regulator)